MQNIISLELISATSENGFSLDELVFRTKELFETEAMAGFVSLILQLIDERICMNIVQGKSDNTGQSCCCNERFEYHDRSLRQFRTSVGTVKISWRRLKCVKCGKTITPLRDFLGLAPYQSKTLELEKLVTEIVSEQSYRRSSTHLESIGSIPVPKSTAHRWVVQTDCDQIDTGTDTFSLLFADGTGFKRRPDKDKRISNRGELRVALGVTRSSSVVPLGAFSGKSWDEISSLVKGERKNKELVADMLVSEGETGLVKSLAKLCNDSQRSHWHLVRDLNYTMWKDDAGKLERKQKQKELNAVIGIEIPEEDFEKVCDDDKKDLQDAVNSAESDLHKLIGKLLEKGYKIAADYLNRSAKNMFSYARRWLETGIVTPRVSSMIERMMRELGRRLKRIAFGWSEEGAAKMARIIIKRFTSENQWEKYWHEKLRLLDNVMLALKTIKVQNPQTLGR
ncbi:hypothetical protein L21SP3_01583 [Sedimentisphaera cyanobacteriorum]|uniref:DUF6431 domain-containing protein n=1 Tax=Sedimentisphaera cyanobacteriorum TaxID=1940790 RepID=A0A1Q2HR12_9BACT|nr:DUF6431 domain-containing protein [Sedimentisphaera cyanobacteriorum]AQQ08586.1 hypothetical protein L21SP3_00373 [Sedimentisphaera cyanobacteriorum]AQQ09771.1 hypothetical protein L21SP3_01583 [Sedimentisphaera cyanobacteriorum]